jgi:hypothetical protein
MQFKHSFGLGLVNWGYIKLLFACVDFIQYSVLNHLTPNGHFSGRTVLLTYRCCIFYLFNRCMY